MKTLEQRFYAKVVKTDSCWLWVGALYKSGYGRMRFLHDGVMREESVHRVSWKLFHGPFDESLKVLHKCDIPSCVNPSHLFLGSQKDNVRDMVEKGRSFKPIGELNPNSKLTFDDAKAVRHLRNAELRPLSEIASFFGIGKSQASKIATGVSW